MIETNEFLLMTEEQKKDVIRNMNSKEVWDLVIRIGKLKEPSSVDVANKFKKDDITTIIALMEFFGATNIWMKQTYFDLTVPKFRLFDWLAMCIDGRIDDDTEQNMTALRVMVWSYLKVNGDPFRFIDDLRVTDYQIDEDYNCLTQELKR